MVRRKTTNCITDQAVGQDDLITESYSGVKTVKYNIIRGIHAAT